MAVRGSLIANCIMEDRFHLIVSKSSIKSLEGVISFRKSVIFGHFFFRQKSHFSLVAKVGSAKVADLVQKYPFLTFMHRIKPQPELNSNFYRILFVILVENILIFYESYF